MKKRKLCIAIPLLAIGALVINSWITFINSFYTAHWTNIVALLLYVILVLLFIRRGHLARVGTGIYLLLGVFNLLSMTVERTSFGIVIASGIWGVNPLSIGLLIIFTVLNLDLLIEKQLDYKEKKQMEIQSAVVLRNQALRPLAFSF